MASADPTTKTTPKPLVIARSFAAPRELVFRAWSTAEHIKRWFCPEQCTIPEAQVEFRAGGAFVVCMRALEGGKEYWSRGRFVEVTPPDRLVFTSEVSVGAAIAFTVHTTVVFGADGAGTRMTEILDEAFMRAVEGSAEGWRSTLDKLEREVARMKSSVVHDTFTLERVFRATPTQVFHALTDEAAKAAWFSGGDAYTTLERVMDVRPGGRERVKGRWNSGMVTTFDAVYFDVVTDERLVYAYEMHLDDRKISVSLATVELTPVANGTRFEVTEQGAFLDGYDDAGSRERGTQSLLDRLAASVEGGVEK